jgi:acid phosphatase family membrane protein YuiD
MKDHEIDRLLRSAAQAREEVPAEMPFGFDTRVVALWRALAAKPNGIASLLRRVALLSALVIAISTLAAVREIKQNREQLNDLTNEFAIADTAIEDEFSQ